MCGHSDVVHGGDAIAIIHSLALPETDSGPWKIVFKNEATPGQDSACSILPLTRYKCLHCTLGTSTKSDLLIHESGDLTSDLARIMCRITIDEHKSEWSLLGESLDLSVGPAGIIGRGVSLIEGDVVVGRGVIGYASR